MDVGDLMWKCLLPAHAGDVEGHVLDNRVAQTADQLAYFLAGRAAALGKHAVALVAISEELEHVTLLAGNDADAINARVEVVIFVSWCMSLIWFTANQLLNSVRSNWGRGSHP